MQKSDVKYCRIKRGRMLHVSQQLFIGSNQVKNYLLSRIRSGINNDVKTGEEVKTEDESKMLQSQTN